MHDWTLTNLSIDWISGSGYLQLRQNGAEPAIRFQHVQRLLVPREFPWGRSVSINAVEGPTEFEGKLQLKLEMQSGDVIEIVAESFDIPGPTREIRRSG